MEFIMDMVHHNPGEPPCKTEFLKPEKLIEYGYNAQVFKHINTAVTFEDYDNELFAESPDALKWINDWADRIYEEISLAKDKGLKVYYHIDLFVLPKAVYDKYKDEICDADGKISIYKEKTLEIHRAMFDEIFKKFPIDGFIIRVGETYLHDTPYHIGNGAVKYGNAKEEQESFIRLINFLREEICVKHDKYVFFRTWDCYPNKFHANKDYYLSITDKIDTHEKLLFSIKHTAVDFWRRVKFNDCLTAGKHRQIIEVQCQREYEGKGAYPTYVMNGVINSFAENKEPKGLRDIVDHPLICGVYTWTRGGGWYGPYLKNEFWCDLNSYVISRYSADTTLTEEEIFNEYASKVMGLSDKDIPVWRKLCMTANNAILRGRYVEAYDRTLNEEIMPCLIWMRDDKLGGLRQLEPVFEYLYKNDLLEDALVEKKLGYLLWQEVLRLFEKIHIPDEELSQFIKTSIEYGVLLFDVVYQAWNVMAIGYTVKKRNLTDMSSLRIAISDFDAAWSRYYELENNEYAASLYEDKYLWEEGLGETISYFRELISSGG